LEALKQTRLPAKLAKVTPKTVDKKT